ncbi:hypothetical protein [Dysosmobacter sp.]|uniref:hypothetical protein n=1 Tax=Dysosmobacter sp. TaxID=2591382 RepID=UPI002A943FC6|nr:hypothetical protein [Dysosmobacter sp.]MDY5509502.1 hypothetical protein [Dysosmobacter sp.]
MTDMVWKAMGLVSLYIGGFIAASLILSRAASGKQEEPDDGDITAALLWPLTLAIILVAAPFKGAAWLQKQIWADVRRKADADEEPGSLDELRGTGDCLRRIIWEHSHNIAYISVSPKIYDILMRRESLVVGVLRHEGQTEAEVLFQGVPIRPDEQLKGFSFYWKEAF